MILFCVAQIVLVFQGTTWILLTAGSPPMQYIPFSINLFLSVSIKWEWQEDSQLHCNVALGSIASSFIHFISMLDFRLYCKYFMYLEWIVVIIVD